jgi:hypothetical protein
VKGQVMPICPECEYACTSLSIDRAACQRCGQILPVKLRTSRRWFNDGMLVDVPRVIRASE